MSKYRKKPVVIEATQWFENGDHPEDGCTESVDGKLVPEGKVVRYFRTPQMPTVCEVCGKSLNDHGWIDTLETGHRVCPGDFIITGVKGERYPCKPEIFALTYEAVE